MRNVAEVVKLLSSVEMYESIQKGEHDRKIAHTLSAIESSVHLEELSSRISVREARILNNFAFRAANMALRTGELPWVRSGLIAAQVAIVIDDDRDIIPSYACLYYATEVVSGAAADDFFGECTYIDEGELRETPAQFARRLPELRSIDAMGLKAEDTKCGIQLRVDPLF